jgi:WD40 repeat protein
MRCEPGRVGPPPLRTRARDVAVRPDGKRIATAGCSGGVTVWDTDTGVVVKELPADEPSQVGFSPDGRWLVTTAGGCRLWDAATWVPGPVLGGTAFAFADEVPLMAVETGKGVIRLLDPATGRDYVRLDDPEQDAAAQLCLSADGSRLINLTRDNSRSIHVWNLRAVRRRLADVGLAGDWPAR